LTRGGGFGSTQQQQGGPGSHNQLWAAKTQAVEDRAGPKTGNSTMMPAVAPRRDCGTVTFPSNSFGASRSFAATGGFDPSASLYYQEKPGGSFSSSRGYQQGSSTFRQSGSATLASSNRGYSTGNTMASSRSVGAGPTTATTTYGAGPGYRNLWQTQVKPITGAVQERKMMAPQPRAGLGASSRYVDQTGCWRTACHETAGAQVDRSFQGGADDFVQTERLGYHHIPGYSGMVRGKRFTYGNTFGATTFKALDTPSSVAILP
jgi:hypothetical protein